MKIARHAQIIKLINQYDIETQVGTVDVGVRVEVRDEIMEELFHQSLSNILTILKKME